MVKEKLNSFITKHFFLIEKATLPLTVGIFSIGSAVHEGNRRFLVREAYLSMEVYGEVPLFLRGTSWVLSRLRYKEVENAMLEGREAFRAKKYEGIPKTYWDFLDTLNLD